MTKRMILAGLDVGLQHESLIRIPSRPRGHEVDLLLALRANVGRGRREVNRFERARSTGRSGRTPGSWRPWRTRWAWRARRPRRTRRTGSTRGSGRTRRSRRTGGAARPRRSGHYVDQLWLGDTWSGASHSVSDHRPGV